MQTLPLQDTRRMRGLGLDLGLWIAAAPAAFLLSGGLSDWQTALAYTAVSAVLKAVLLSQSDLTRHYVHFFSTSGIRGLLRTVALGEAMLLVGLLLLRALGLGALPITVPLTEGLLALAFLLGIRFLHRVQTEQKYHKASAGQRTLILGAGAAGQLLAREMLRQPNSVLRPVGFLDDDVQKQGQLIVGLPVLGSIRGNIGAHAQAVGAERIVIALPSVKGENIRLIHDEAKETGLGVQIMPSLSELLVHRPQIPQLRDVNLADLLRRPPSQLVHKEIGAYLTGQTVLITGAGGSIGSELARQVARYEPGQIVLFGRGENSIFAIQQELLEAYPNVPQTAIIGDVRHAQHMRILFERFRPQVVLHAAAHKHVPLMEDSPSEAIYNNVIGTRILTALCLEFGVRRYVNISSDKAVNPTSVMGSSKRLAEMIISVAAQSAAPDQAFMSVRFGNVLGSRGSVVPTFIRQIEAGGPVTITDQRMTRYFMTIPEASRLVLQAGALAGNGKVYVLKMGNPVKIVDLARDLIKLSGRDIAIKETGIRRGEKLYEELLTDREKVDETSHEEIFEARLETPDPEWLEAELSRLESYAREEDYVHVREQIRRMIPESHLGAQ